MQSINLMRVLESVDINSVMNNPDPMSERLAMSLQMMILGLATVFAVLIVIWAVLVLLRVFLYDMRKPKEASAPKTQLQKETPAPVAPAPAATPAPAADDKQLIAVIAAAIAEAEGKPVSSFRVVSFRRTGSPRWNER